MRVKSLDQAQIARLKIKDHTFEIFIDAEAAYYFKEGKIKDIREVLIVEEIFKDAKKGERVSEELLKETFGTSNVYKIAEEIIRKGEVPITSELRRKLIEEKKKQIVEIIHREAVDPKTKLPHPPQRILNAMERAGVKIDPFKPVEAQIDGIVKKLKFVIPLKFEKAKLAFRIPPEYVGKAMSVLKKNLNILKEEWGNDGSWLFLIEIPAGMKEEIISKVQSICKGNADVRILEK